WCNLANVAFRAGKPYKAADAGQASSGTELWQELLGSMGELLGAYGLKMESDAIRLSPLLEVDARAEKFVGAGAETANGFLKRQYRAPYVVPAIEG
ncbi:MAG: gfo/Idh/MocA family oxidoreductase, partial [Thermoguttaceae bacterium]